MLTSRSDVSIFHLAALIHERTPTIARSENQVGWHANLCMKFSVIILLSVSLVIIVMTITSGHYHQRSDCYQGSNQVGAALQSLCHIHIGAAQS
jgi:hypothetical protein